MTLAPTSVQHREPRSHRWLLVAVPAFLAGLALALLFEFDVFGGSTTSGLEGSGTAAQQTRTVAAFRSVELSGANNIVIHVGEKQSVVVKADDNLLDRVTTEVRGGRLVVGMTPGSFTTKSPMSIEVGVPSLDGVTLSGSGNIVVSGIDTESLTVTLSGSGTLTGSGSATRLAVAVSGSGNALFESLLANDVQAVVSGSGFITVTATESLDASVPGSGAIVYSGNPPDVTKSVTGSGTINP